MKRMISILLTVFIMMSVLFVGGLTASGAVLGDCNDDGKINGKDVLLMRKYIVGLENEINEDAADVNSDGKINGKDVLKLRKAIIGLEALPTASSTEPTTQGSKLLFAEASSSNKLDGEMTVTDIENGVKLTSSDTEAKYSMVSFGIDSEIGMQVLKRSVETNGSKATVYMDLTLNSAMQNGEELSECDVKIVVVGATAAGAIKSVSSKITLEKDVKTTFKLDFAAYQTEYFYTKLSLQFYGDENTSNYDVDITSMYSDSYGEQPTNAPTAPPTTTKYVSAESLENVKTIGEIQDSINTLGRSIISDGKLVADFASTGFEFTISNDEPFDIGLILIWTPAACALGIVIDDNDDAIERVNIDPSSESQFVVIARDIPAGTHTVKVLKITDQTFQRMTIESLCYNGTLGSRPEQSDLKFEFYGDSITCGVGVLCPDRNLTSPASKWENSHFTYAAVASRILGAEYSICAQGGYGWLHGYDNDKQLISTIWDKATVNGNNQTWDFDSYDADVVFFALGTNDNNHCKMRGDSFTQEEIEKAVTDMINNVRSYNPDCKIVFIGGFGVSFNNDYFNLEAVEKKIAENDENIYYAGDFESANSGGGWHPNVSEQKSVGTALAKYLKENEVV